MTTFKIDKEPEGPVWADGMKFVREDHGWVGDFRLVYWLDLLKEYDIVTDEPPEPEPELGEVRHWPESNAFIVYSLDEADDYCWRNMSGDIVTDKTAIELYEKRPEADDV